MTPQELTVIGTLGGALIGSLATLAVTWLSKRSEDKRHHRQMVINTAVENYKAQIDAAKITGGKVLSLDYYVIHMLKLAELMGKRKITPEEIDKIYDESEELQDKMYERLGRRLGSAKKE